MDSKFGDPHAIPQAMGQGDAGPRPQFGALPLADWEDADQAFSNEEVHALALASLRSESETVQCVSRWLRQGRGIEDLYLCAITQAARLLGHWWLSDRIRFSDVTVGSSRLHRLLYDLSPLFLADKTAPRDATVLLLAEPGSQHTMGMFMLSEFFKRDGWHTLVEQAQSALDATRLATHHWIDLVAISVSSDRQFEALRAWVQNVRMQSPNRYLQIVAGGPMAQLMPDALLELGVDWVGSDAKATIAQANHKTFQKKQ